MKFYGIFNFQQKIYNYKRERDRDRDRGLEKKKRKEKTKDNSIFVFTNFKLKILNKSYVSNDLNLSSFQK